MTSLLPAPVASVVNRLARSFAWLALDDLAQEAALASLVADRTWQAWRGPLGAWQAFVARRELIDMARSWGRIVQGNAAPFGYLDLSDAPEPSYTPDLDAAIDTARALARIRAMLAELPAAIGVLLEQSTPDEVAAELGVSKARVYRETFKAREAVRMELAR